MKWLIKKSILFNNLFSFRTKENSVSICPFYNKFWKIIFFKSFIRLHIIILKINYKC